MGTNPPPMGEFEARMGLIGEALTQAYTSFGNEIHDAFAGIPEEALDKLLEAAAAKSEKQS
jgi:hypothetical protein